MPVTLLTLLACAGAGGPSYGGSGSANVVEEDSGTGGTAGTADTGDGAVWELMVDGLEDGFLTGAWTHGDEVLVAGGEINGGRYGFMTHIRADEVCLEEAVTDAALWWVHGATEERFFASGEDGTLLRNEGGQWHDESTGEGGVLYGLFDAGERAWAVQGNGTIWTRDDSGWSIYKQGLTQLFKTWCAGPDQCVFVGENRIYQLDGEDFSEHKIDGQIWTCRGRSWSDIWCVGGTSAPVVYHYDGADWSSVDTTGLSVPMFGVWTAEGEDVWVGGAKGVMGRYLDGQWVTELSLTNEEIHGVWKEGDDVYFVGGNLNASDGDHHGVIVHHGPARGLLEPQPCADLP